MTPAKITGIPESPPPALMRRRRNAFLGTILLFLAVFAAYYPTLRNGFIWDDDRYITGNLQLRTLHGLGQIWANYKSEPQYYPLTHSTFWVEYHLWQLNPLGYHLDNILLHAISALILWQILNRLKIPGAFVVAAIFAVHPVQVESIGWATERKNVLSGLLYFSAVAAYLETRWGREICVEPSASAEINPQESRPMSYWGWYALALLCYIGAILSKSVTSTLPLVILLLTWWKRGKFGRRQIIPLIPMLILGGAMGWLTSWMEKHWVGAVGPMFDVLTPLARCCIAGRAVWFYLSKIVWPINLVFIYPRWHVDPANHPAQMLWPVAALAFPIALGLLQKRLKRGPLAAILFFGITLAPALGFTNVFPMRFSFVADHFQYLAMIGPVALITTILYCHLGSRPGGILAAITIVLLVIASNTRSRVFADQKTLWAQTARLNPNSPMAHQNYGQALKSTGDVDAAEREYRTAVAIQEDATGDIGLGQCYAQRGDFLQALDWYRRALAMTPTQGEPVIRWQRAVPWFQMGTAYGELSKRQTDPAEAHAYRLKGIDAYQNSLAVYPDYEVAALNLADLLTAEGRSHESADICRHVLTANPESVPAHTMLGNALLAQNQIDDALAEYRKALDLDPNNPVALNDVGLVLASRGHPAEAIDYFQKVIRQNPQDVPAIINLGAANAKLGRLNDAIRYYHAALRLEPQNNLAKNNLAQALKARDPAN